MPVSGTVPAAEPWGAPAALDRAPPVVSHVHTAPVVSRPGERGWPAATVAPIDRARQLQPQPGTVVNPPIIHVPPTSNNFLTSAANIMMGVGLAGNRGTADVRYDAYKQLSGSNIRRY